MWLLGCTKLRNEIETQLKETKVNETQLKRNETQLKRNSLCTELSIRIL